MGLLTGVTRTPAVPVLPTVAGGIAAARATTAPARGASSRLATPPAGPTPPLAGEVARETYHAGNVELPDGDLGKLVRKEGQAPIGDKPVDDAHDNAKVVFDFYKTVLGRNSLDNAGMALKSTAHYGQDFNNAYWDGTHMTYGDGDGHLFTPFSGSLDVVAHEMAHGVTERTAGLNYENQPGALNESWSDVFGEFVQQWRDDRTGFAKPDGAKAAKWMIGEDVFTPGTDGDALRSIKAPGTAYPGDPQPAHMRDYKKMSDDYGGVHINSGIPNKATYEVATRIGSEKTAKIWYRTLSEYLKPSSQFKDAANYTVSAARDLFGKDAPEVQAVRDGWKSVGINPRLITMRLRSEQPATVTPGKNPGVVPPWLGKPTEHAHPGLTQARPTATYSSPAALAKAAATTISRPAVSVPKPAATIARPAAPTVTPR